MQLLLSDFGQAKLGDNGKPRQHQAPGLKQFFPLPLPSHIVQEGRGDSFDSISRSACRKRFEKGHVLQ